MRLLFVIPHFFKGIDARATNRSHRADARDERMRSLIATIASLHQNLGAGAYGLDHFSRVAWQPAAANIVDIVVCTTGDAHLLDDLPRLHPSYRHHATTADPLLLGFECHRVLREARGRYDYYGYLEDDIVLIDPLFFRKRRLFDQRFGPDALLQPNRYEARPDGAVRKLYVDYRLSPARTAAYQEVAVQPLLEIPFIDETIAFERTSYPSAGCFFLNAEQLAKWVGAPAFLDGDVSYLSPLDSAATLSIMKTFRIYKPALAQASFLEVLHASPRWIPTVSEMARLAPCHESFVPQHFPQVAP
jgi:hypothetical protein